MSVRPLTSQDGTIESWKALRRAIGSWCEGQSVDRPQRIEDCLQGDSSVAQSGEIVRRPISVLAPATATDIASMSNGVLEIAVTQAEDAAVDAVTIIPVEQVLAPREVTKNDHFEA